MKPKRLIAVFGAVLLAIAGVLVWAHRWSKLPYYLPADSGSLPVAFRTMAEHDELMRDREWPYVVQLDSAEGGGALTYFGSWHTDDPDDPQIARIVELWDDFRPTVAVTENRLGFFVGGLDGGVRAFGEFACAFALGRRDDVPVYTLEPPWEVEVAEMKAAFPAEEVTLFYTLRVFLSERGDTVPDNRAEIDSLAASLLAKRGSRPGLRGTLPDLAALDALWDERFTTVGAWREMPGHLIHPAVEPNRLQELANLANEVRDRHAARVILELLEDGERVFAIAGGSHVVKQEPVLRSFPISSGVDPR